MTPEEREDHYCECFRTALDLSDGDSDRAFEILVMLACTDDHLAEALAATVRRIWLELWQPPVRHS